MLDKETIQQLKANKDLINFELLTELRKTKEGKQIALDILDIPKDDEEYYLDAFGKRISFDGLRTIKKAYTKINLSKIHIEEMQRCFESLEYFKDNYIKIKTPTTGVNFPDMREYQNRFLSEINTDDEAYLVLFPRQSGKSITTSIYLVYLTLFKNDINVGICANKSDTAREFLNNVKNIIEALPIWMQQGIKSWNKGRIETENGVRILTDATNSNSFRGYTCAVIVVDECAYIPTTLWQEFADGVLPSQSSLSWKKNIFLSTMNGMNHFHQMIKGARLNKVLKGISKEELEQTTGIKEYKQNADGTFDVTLNKSSNGYKLVEVDWREVPRYDSKGNRLDPEVFKQNIVDKQGIVFFKQAYENCAIGSSYTLLSGDALEKLHSIDPILKRDGLLKIYEEPKAKHKYIMAVDPSKDGIDGFAVKILDVTKFPFIEVASCSLQIDYFKMPEYLNEWGLYYNTAFIIVENNEGAGQSVADMLWQVYEYENLFKVKGKKYPGFRTTPKTRNLILKTLKLFCENEKLKINDSETINEIFTFILVNGKYQADEGYHDDLVMALALAFVPFCEIKNFSDMKKVIDNFYSKDSEEDFTENLAIGYFDC